MPNVLIVDDDEAIRATLGALLEDEGYHTLQAPDGEPALGVMRRSDSPLVVLLDYMMPRMDGERVLATVAANSELADRHKFILLTANAHKLTPTMRQLLRTLEVPLIPKPFDLDVVVDTVTTAANALVGAA